MSDFAFHRNCATHQFDQLPSDRETEAGAAARAGHRAVDLMEGFEDPRALIGCDADAGILDRELQHHARRRPPGSDEISTRISPRLGELDRVADQVDQDLAQPHGSPITRVRHVLGDEIDEFQPLAGAALGRTGRRSRRSARAGRTRPADSSSLPGFDLRQVEDVVDDAEQRLAGPRPHCRRSRRCRVVRAVRRAAVRPCRARRSSACGFRGSSSRGIATSRGWRPRPARAPGPARLRRACAR